MKHICDILDLIEFKINLRSFGALALILKMRFTYDFHSAASSTLMVFFPTNYI